MHNTGVTLCQKDPLEKEMATYSSILTWKTSWTEDFGRLQSMGQRRLVYDLATECTHTFRKEFELMSMLRTNPGFAVSLFYLGKVSKKEQGLETRLHC